MGKRAMEMIEAQIDALNANVAALSARSAPSGARREARAERDKTPPTATAGYLVPHQGGRLP